MNFRELFSTSKTHGQQFLFKGVRVMCSWKHAKPFYTRLCPCFNVKSWEFWSQLHCKVVSIQWSNTEISSLLWRDERIRWYERILSTSKCKNKTLSRAKWSISPLEDGERYFADILKDILTCRNKRYKKQSLKSLDQIQMIVHTITIQAGKYRLFGICNNAKEPQESDLLCIWKITSG